MRVRQWTEDYERLILDAAPDAAEGSDAELRRIWERVAVGTRGKAKPRRQRTRVAAAAGVVTLVLGTSAVAAGEFYSARTGDGPIDAEDRRLGGPGERLDPAAADYGQVIAQETDEIPFPDAVSRTFAVRDQVVDGERHTTPGESRVSVGAVRAWVADAAICAWSNQWAAATRGGDEANRAEATRMILQAPSWPAVTAIDPDPYSRMKTQEVIDENGVLRTQPYVDESQFYYLGTLGSAVRGRDVSAVADVLALNNGYCRPELVPDIPRANPLFRER